MYILFITLALISGLLCSCIILYKNGVQPLFIFLLSLMNLSSTLFGAVLFTFVSTGFDKLGMNTAGGTLGLLISVSFFCHMSNSDKWMYMKAFILPLPLMYGIGKIACTYAGCCSGLQFNNGYVFPIQLVECIVFLCLFIISIYFYRKNKFNPVVAAFIYGIVKILLDFLRETHEKHIISFNQVGCLVVLVLFVVVSRYLNQNSMIEDN